MADSRVESAISHWAPRFIANGVDYSDWQHMQRLHAEAGPAAELLLLEDGNHGCANVTYRHRPYGSDWMARQLAG